MLEDVSVPLRLKLSALWASTMFLFAYGDIFTGYRTDIIEDLRTGELGGFDVNQAFLLATSVYVAIPSLMVFLSLVLRPAVNRRTNIVLGSVYAVTIALSVIGEGWAYFVFLSVVEVALVMLIVWYAWRWPEQAPEATQTYEATEGGALDCGILALQRGHEPPTVGPSRARWRTRNQ